MTLDFCSRRDLTARLEAGWRLVPGHEYRAGDYAILLMLPEAGEVIEAMTAAQIRTACASLYRYRSAPKPRGMSARNQQRIRAKLRLQEA